MSKGGGGLGFPLSIHWGCPFGCECPMWRRFGFTYYDYWSIRGWWMLELGPVWLFWTGRGVRRL